MWKNISVFVIVGEFSIRFGHHEVGSKVVD